MNRETSRSDERLGAQPLPGSHIHHYEIIRPLGAGGMGHVLLARDCKLERLVAIKLLHEVGSAGTRLIAEAQATARARHENIVVIYEVGVFHGRPYMVLEHLDGRTLRQLLSGVIRGEGPSLPRGLSLDIMASVIRALTAAHRSGVVHRDLKPENIMLLDSGQVKVLDFGIARVRGEEGPGRRAGTRAYMSPEQWRGEEIDERSDIWAAGVILYELLAGVHPLEPRTAERLETIADPQIPMPILGDARPELAELSVLVERCLRKNREERFGSADELLATLEPFIARSRIAPIGEGERPFAGLAAFHESDADRFFGRARDVSAVLGSLGRQALVMVAGPSGAGKSSFVRAGLIPALRRSGEDWEILVVRPGFAPLSALTEALGTVVGDLRENPALFGARLRARCRARGTAHRLLVFVDQLEELHTLVPDAVTRAAFLACLRGAADDASSPLRVVASIRSDFLDRIGEDRPFMALVGAGLFFLPPVDGEGLREALTQPVAATGYRFEDEALIDDMLDELSRTRSPLPLLQFAALALWEARDRERKLLGRAAYEAMGGVGGALATHADSVVSGLPASDQRVCRAIFLRLVTPERTRAMATLGELSTLGEGREVEAVVQRLAAARLLLVDVGADQGSARVELVHEALIDRWPTLARWLDENAGDARFLASLRAAASQWHERGEPTGILWRDRAAEEARKFYERHRRAEAETGGTPIGALEKRYLEAVMALADRARKTRNRAIAAAFALVSAIAFVVLVLALDARKQARRADEEAARVRERNAELAFQALRGRNATRILAARRREDDPTVALAILREIEPPDLPREWAELVSAALISGVARDVWRSSPDRVGYAAVMSPDGRRIAVAMDDHTTRILDENRVERVRLVGHEKLVWSVDWSPDGRRVVTASNDLTARIWSADGSGEPLVLRGHEDLLNDARMSPDGRRVVTAADDRTARVWSAEDGRELFVLPHHAEVRSAAWSPGGERIVTASTDGIARVWSANGKGQPSLLRGHAGMLTAAAFHPDGKRIATAGQDRTVRVWDARDGAELVVLRGHEEKVLSVAWSPDGTRISSASKDKTARIWRADGKGNPIVLRGHEHWVYTATWSPDGRRILTTSLDGTQRRWHLADIVAPTLLRGHEDTVRGLVFSPDGARIATASFDRTARIWNADGSGEEVVLRGHTDKVHFIRWSPDGARIATASADGTARIWSADGSAAPLVLPGHDSTFQMLDWSPDGERLVTASLDGTFRAWSKDGVELAVASKKTTTEFKWIRATFDPSGSRVLIMDTSDSKVYLWSTEARAEFVPLGDHGELVRFAQWSPDGSQVVTLSIAGTGRLWDVARARAPVQIVGPKPILNALWSPDGRRLVFFLEDGSMRPWSGGALGEALGAPIPREGNINALFNAGGDKLLTSSTSDGKVRVRYADGSGVPFVLASPALALSYAYWSPRGDRIAVHYEDKFAWVWPNVRPFSGTDDARLWAATAYCIPAATRVELLGVTEAEARDAEEVCRSRVAEASGARRPR